MYNLIFENLAIAESKEISDITGCLKPCHYKKYILGEPSPSNFKSEHYIFSMWAVSSKTKVETEELIYPMSTLVAEFGGTLGLFLGFSFISIWDNFSTLERCVTYLKAKSWFLSLSNTEKCKYQQVIFRRKKLCLNKKLSHIRIMVIMCPWFRWPKQGCLRVYKMILIRWCEAGGKWRFVFTRVKLY